MPLGGFRTQSLGELSFSNGPEHSPLERPGKVVCCPQLQFTAAHIVTITPFPWLTMYPTLLSPFLASDFCGVWTVLHLVSSAFQMWSGVKPFFITVFRFRKKCPTFVGLIIECLHSVERCRLWLREGQSTCISKTISERH